MREICGQLKPLAVVSKIGGKTSVIETPREVVTLVYIAVTIIARWRIKVRPFLLANKRVEIWRGGDKHNLSSG